MKLSKKELIEGFNILTRSTNNDFESPLYDPKKYKPQSSLNTPDTETETRTATPFGGGPDVSFTSSPTIQQRLKLSLGDTSLSRQDRGVPKDQSKELVDSGKDQYYTRITRWKNPTAYMGGMQSATFYDRVKRPNT